MEFSTPVAIGFVISVGILYKNPSTAKPLAHSVDDNDLDWAFAHFQPQAELILSHPLSMEVRILGWKNERSDLDSSTRMEKRALGSGFQRSDGGVENFV